jgi:hypothetical protein
MADTSKPVPCSDCGEFDAVGECPECGAAFCEDCGAMHGCDGADLDDGDPGEP